MSSKLDAAQVIKGAYNEVEQALNVVGDVAISNGPDPINIVGTVSVSNAAGIDILHTVEVDSADIEGSGDNYFEVVSSTSADTTQIVVYDTTGATLELATGAAASEVTKVILGPGCDQTFAVDIPAGTRISIRSREVAAPGAGSNFVVTLIGG